MDGQAVWTALRVFTTAPIVVLSVRGDEAGKVRLLDISAPTITCVKPFGHRRISGAVCAALRHRLQQSGQDPILVLGSVEVDLVKPPGQP